MFGYHGPASAPGVRTAVLSETFGSLHRALLLLGLLTGALVSGWLLGVADAEAEEISPGEDTVMVDASVTDTVDLAGDTVAADGPAIAAEERDERIEGVEPSQVNADSQPVDGHEVVETGEIFEAAETSQTRPPADGVAQTGRETSTTVREVSESVTPEVEVDGTDLVKPAHRAVDEVTRTAEDRSDQVESPSPEEADPVPASGEGPTTHSQAVVERGDTLLAPEHQRARTAVDAAGHADSTVTESNADPGVRPRIDPRGSVPSGTASTPNGAVAGLAGHLPTSGAPIPSLTFEDAARHVLRAVPTAVADEPTFAPD